MEAFEQVVSEILWMDGYWFRASVKVDLSKEEKLETTHFVPRELPRILRMAGNLKLLADCSA